MTIKSHKNGPFLTKALKSHKFSGFLFLLSGLQLKTQLFVITILVASEALYGETTKDCIITQRSV